MFVGSMSDPQVGPKSTAAPVSESTALLSQAAPSSGSIKATVKLALTSGAGLAADGYDLCVINLGLAILGFLYPESFTPAAKGFAVSITIVGVVIGQLSFGFLADFLGRKMSSIATASLTVAGAILSGCVQDTNGSGWSICGQLALARFILGLGIGGEYPLSAAISKEVENNALCLRRSQMLCLNMAAFNVGMLLQAVLVLFLLACSISLEAVWRIALIGGLVPSLIAMALRLGMHEPQVDDAGASGQKPGYFSSLASVAGAKRTLLCGACLCWFLFNVTAYGANSFSAIISENFFTTEGLSTAQVVRQDALFSFVVSLFQLTGSALGLVVESSMARRDLQLCGFTGLSLFILLCGVLSGPLQNEQGWVLGAFFMLFQICGALVGITTYLIPSEAFPAAVRGTCVGLSAASGKVGASLGTAFFPVTEKSFGLSAVLVACAAIMAAGSAATFILIPARLNGGDGPAKEESRAAEKDV